MTAVIGYLTKRFPRLSETFILGEILGLQAAGVDLRVYSLADPGEAIVQPETARVRGGVRYLHTHRDLGGSVREVGATLCAHARLLIHSPRRYLGVVAYVARSRRQLSAIRHFLEAGRLAHWLEAAGATHLHAAFAHGPASVAHFVHLLTGLPYSFSAHAKDLYRSPADLLAVKVAAARFALVCSAAAADDLRRIAGPAAGKVILAYHGVDTSRFSPASSPPPEATGPLRLLAVGRLVAKKGYPILLEALAQLARRDLEVECRILGTGDCRPALEEMIMRLGLSRRVTLLGAGTQSEVLVQLGWAQAFVQASVVLSDGDRDGIPNALLEAMATGLPIVATPVGGIAEVISSGNNGLLVRSGDASDLAGALASFIIDPVGRQRLGRAARAHVVAHFDRLTCAAEVAGHFLTVATPGG